MSQIIARNFISNQNGTDKSIQYLKSLLKLRSVLIFTRSLTSHIGNKGALEHMYFRNVLGVGLLEQVP